MAEPSIDRLMETSGKVDLSDIDWDSVRAHPIHPEALRTLRYFQRTESSTFFYVKALMRAKATVQEPEFAPFLAVWMYEEEFHGRAFAQFMRAAGEDVPNDVRQRMYAERAFGERFDELGQMLVSHVFEPAWPSIHMIWGVIQELTTYTAYQALVERVNHPVLNVICDRIMKQELRHYAFYRAQAKRRLAESAIARKGTTWALKLAWTPVGDGMSPKSEVRHALQFLFDGNDGTAIRGIEEKIRALPGLEWFDLFTKFCAEHRIGRAPDDWFPTRARVAAE